MPNRGGLRGGARGAGRHPDWPVVVAQTSLHEGYPQGMGHVLPYPFVAGEPDRRCPAESWRGRSRISARCLRRSPASVAPGFAAIDFTQPGDGLEPPDYGREALIAALVAAAPAAVRVALKELPGAAGEADARSVNAHILGFAVAAGASDAVPVAGLVDGAGAAGRHAAPGGEAARHALGPARLCRVPGGTRRGDAAAHGLDVRHQAAGEAGARLRADRRRGNGRRGELRGDLCHRAGRRAIT